MSEELGAETGIIDLQKGSAVWILKIRELHRLPLSVMDDNIMKKSLQNTPSCDKCSEGCEGEIHLPLNKCPKSSLKEENILLTLKNNHNK